jgi:hypothetical protein
MVNMLYQAELDNPFINARYRQHQYLEDVFGNVRPREYVWGEADGLLFVRRSIPTDDLDWYPIDLPPADSMITIQVEARARRPIEANMRSRPTISDPLENITWLEWVGSNIGLQVEHCEVETGPVTIRKPHLVQRVGGPRKRPAFSLLVTQFMAVARVIDPRQFERGLTHGIGDSKAFGCGFIHFWVRGQHNA